MSILTYIKEMSTKPCYLPTQFPVFFIIYIQEKKPCYLPTQFPDHPENAHVFFVPFSAAKVIHFVYKPIRSVEGFSRVRLHRLSGLLILSLFLSNVLSSPFVETDYSNVKTFEVFASQRAEHMVKRLVIVHLCRPEQRDALLKFKNEFASRNPSCNYDCYIYPTTVRPHPKTESWTNNSDCCDWEGIKCNIKSGEVMKLDLRCSCLHGHFQSSSGLRNLHFLTFIDLSYNQFSGQILYLIGNLSRLTTLDLSNNQFMGQIPSSIGNVSRLTSLFLHNNQFSGQIPSSIGNVSRLTSLFLHNNQFMGQIPSSIGNLSQLTSLILSENQFMGQIPYSIGNLSQLTSLTLSFNNLVGEIPSSFGNLNQLTFLAISANKLRGNFPIVLLNFTGLTNLLLYHNQFTGTLPPNLTSLSNLQVLDIGSNNFIGPIPRSISKLVNLDSLDLSHLNTQAGPVDFSIFSHLKSLESLTLSHLNTTTTIDLNDILSYVKTKRLSSLDLSGNHVSATNKSSVSDPPLPLIGYLDLSGCGITELPELLRTQYELRTLDISNNKIRGQVPGWLWTQKNLYYVNLSNNTFNGFQRPTKLSSVRKPSTLKHLLGSNNNFTGKIPSFICELRSLKTLDLSDNNFNGSIPRCIGNLKSNLSDLNLRQNNLSGGLPEHIFESLRSLDVGHNQLMGKLPRSLIRLSNLEVLNVRSNKINDTFPFWLSSLQKLQVLVLRSNAFHGPIHQASFPKLRIIDISHNHFNGTLPSDFFVKWSALSSLGTDEDRWNVNYMGDVKGYYHDSVVLMNRGVELELVRILKIYTAVDFSGNKFEGEIPKSIGLLKELHVLNLANNAFTGRIPSSMGNLIALESLDVSQNKLSGEIPQELGNLSFLSYMNFSHNKLAGLVPGGIQFHTQPCSSYEDNQGLFGSSLDEACRHIHTPASKQYETPESEEEDEEVISWIAAAVGFMPGIFFGYTIGYLLLSYKPEWFMKPFGRRSTTTL